MSIRIEVNPSNPGQFFACCGLLELADRLWNGAEGAFSSSGIEFSLSRRSGSGEADANVLLGKLGACAITSTMTDEQIATLKKLLNQKKASLTSQQLSEKQDLSELWGRERLRLHDPFNIWIDWWGDENTGGNKFKTWAGKQFVLDLVRGLQAPIGSDAWFSLPMAEWLNQASSDRNLPLYFDSDIGGQSSSRDAGFSMDTLEIRSRTKPLTELAALVGLQRFRPYPANRGDSFCYVQWTEPLPPILAAVACSGRLPQRGARTFVFRILYRTKYLKSFLTAAPQGGLNK
ncbi:MAG: type I-G CRISPR-associated protein Cas8g2 [Terriglobia bacterium]